jgi:hypothetical protein
MKWRFITDGEHLVRAGLHRDHRGLAKHDSVVLYKDEGVGGAEIDSNVVREKSKNVIKHLKENGLCCAWSTRIASPRAPSAS